MSLFISLEGGEGSGKTSVIKTLTKKLESYKNLNILTTREPGGIKISEDIRTILLDKKNTQMDSKTEALLFAAARRQHLVEKIIPFLKEDNSIVICDRFIDSSLIYQGIGRNIGIEDVFKINKFAIEENMPNITFYLDLDPKIGLLRISKNKNREVNRLDLESIEFHNKVRKGYLDLCDRFPKRIIKIDANRDLDPIAEEIKDYILTYLKVL